MIYKVTVGVFFIISLHICASIVFIITPCNNDKLFLYFASAKMTLCHLIKCHVDVVSTSTDVLEKKSRDRVMVSQTSIYRAFFLILASTY